MQGSTHLDDALRVELPPVPQDQNGEVHLLVAPTQGAREVELAGGAPRTAHRPQGADALRVEPRGEQLHEARRRQLFELAEEGAVHVPTLLVSRVARITLETSRVAREIPLGQGQLAVDVAETRPRVVAEAVGADRGRDRGRQRGRGAGEAPLADEQLRRAAVAHRLAPLPGERLIDRVRQVTPEQVPVLGRPVHVEGLALLTLAAPPATISLGAAPVAIPAAAIAPIAPVAPVAPVAPLTAVSALVTVAALVGLPAALATPTSTPAPALAVLVVAAVRASAAALALLGFVDLGEDRLVVVFFLREHVRARELAPVHGPVLFAVRLRLRIGEALDVDVEVAVREGDRLLVELAQREDAGLHLDDRLLAAVLLDHRREPGAHRHVGRLADMGEQVLRDRDLRDLLVVEGPAHQPEHLDGSFRERHLSPRKARLASGDRGRAGADAQRIGAGRIGRSIGAAPGNIETA